MGLLRAAPPLARAILATMRASSSGPDIRSSSTTSINSTSISSRSRRTNLVAAAAAAGNGGNGSDPSPLPPRRPPPPLAAWARRLAAAAAGATLLVAAAPALLSTPLGTRAAARVAGAALLAPEQPTATAGVVDKSARGRPSRRRRRRRRLEIDSLRLSWTSPVVACGVRVYESGGSAVEGEDDAPLASAERVSTAEPLLPVVRALLLASAAAARQPGALLSAGAGGEEHQPRTPSINVSVTGAVVDASLRESRDGGGFRVAALFGSAPTTPPSSLSSSSAASSPDAPAAAPSPSPLSVADAEAPFSADVLLSDAVAVCVSEGVLRLPAAVAEALVGGAGGGPSNRSSSNNSSNNNNNSSNSTNAGAAAGRIHLVAAAGARALRAAADQRGERLLLRSREVEAAAAELLNFSREQRQPAPSTPDNKDDAYDLSWLAADSAAAAAAAEGAPPPAPFCAQLWAPRCAAEARGWCVFPRADEPYYVLQRPALAAAELTPALASRTLARANPLLQGAVGLLAEGGGGNGGGGGGGSSSKTTPPRLHVAYSPEGGLVPAERARVSVAPARVALRVAGVTGAPEGGGDQQQQQQQRQGPAAAVGIAAALLELCGVRAIGARGEVLEARVGRMDVDVRGDVFETRAVRVELGAPAAAAAGASGGAAGGWGVGGGRAAAAAAAANKRNSTVAVALWGRYDAASDRVAMRVGLPARAALAAVLPRSVLDRLPPPPPPPETSAQARTSDQELEEEQQLQQLQQLQELQEPPLLTLDVAGPASAPRADWAGAARQLAALSAGAALSAAMGGGGGGG